MDWQETCLSVDDMITGERVLPTFLPLRNGGIGFEIYDLARLQDRLLRGDSLRFDAFVLTYVASGEGSWCINMCRHPLADDTVYCIYPRQLISIDRASTMKGLVIVFSKEFLCPTNDGLRNLLNTGLFGMHSTPSIELSDSIRVEMTALLKSMQQEFLGADRHRLLFLQSLLRMMIILLNRNILASGTAARVPSTDADHVNLYFELVQKHFITKKKVSDYARMMSIPASYLNVVVKRTSGNTAKHFIRQQIVLEAKRLATWEGKNLKETAYLLGYEDVAHFSKFFKQAAGITFSAFRRAQDR